MKQTFKNFVILKQNDLLFKYYSNVMGFAIYIDWLFIPFFTKLLGLHITVFFITFYYLMSETSGYFDSFFKKYNLSSSIKILIFLDIIQVLTYTLYFVNVIYMLYVLMIVFSVQAMYFEILNVKIIEFYELRKTKYSNVQKMLLFNKSNMVLFGLVSTLAYSFFTEDLFYLILIIIFLMVISIYNEFKLLKYLKTL